MRIISQKLTRLGLMIALASAIGFLNTACNVFPETDDSTKAQRDRDNEKLVSAYNEVVGRYEGSVTVGGEPLGAKLFMYIDYVYDGIDPTGSPKSRPVLRSQLKFDGVGEYDDHGFLVDYNTTTGNVSMTQGAANDNSNGTGTKESGSCVVGPRDPQMAISATLLGGDLKGIVNGGGAVIGPLNMNRKSAESIQPSRDQRARLLAAFNKITGTYEGKVQVDGNLRNAQAVLNIVEVTTGVGSSCPKLEANFRLTDTIGKLDDTRLNVSFRETTGDLLFDGASYDAAPRVCSVGPHDTNLRFDGELKNERITGDLRGSLGSFGDMDLEKVSNETKAKDDQRERLLNVYKDVQGNYGGQFKNNNKNPGEGGNDTVNKKNFPFQMIISMIDQSAGGFVTCPVLRGQYIRVDNEFGYGSLSLAIDYYPSNDTIVFTSDTADTGPFPGARKLSITGKIEGGGDITGDMRWWNEVGTAKLDRCRGTVVDKKGRCK